MSTGAPYDGTLQATAQALRTAGDDDLDLTCNPLFLTEPAVLTVATRAAKIASAHGDNARRCALQAANNYAEDRLTAVELAGTWRYVMDLYTQLAEDF